jgi:putative acetyltransferase
MTESTAMMRDLHIRPESPGDETAIRDLLTAAFAGPAEATLVGRLRTRAGVLILVADLDGEIVGSIVFSPVTGNAATAGLQAAGLAPLAVRPDRQRQGIGARLVETGIDACRAQGLGLLIVLGHPDYYPRFGFQPASRAGLRCRWSDPDDGSAFMYLELRPGHAALAGDFVNYGSDFDDL